MFAPFGLVTVLILELQSTFQIFTSRQGLLPSLQTVAYNHGGLWGRYSKRAERWRSRVMALGKARPLFSSLTCGTSRWDRHG